MAQFRDFYIQSLPNPENSFKFCYIKPDRQPGIVLAVEGELEQKDGYSLFKFCLNDTSRHRLALNGRATKKAVASRLADLLRQMLSDGLIAADRANLYISKCAQV